MVSAKKFEESSKKDETNSENDDNINIEKNGDFSNFNIAPSIVTKLKERNINYLYPIQAATLQLIREGHDLIAQARTGTGKTLAFSLPLVEKIESAEYKTEIDNKSKLPKCIVLAPTRELAKQIHGDFKSISTKINASAVYGGVRYESQESEIRQGVHVIIGTPGRILDFIQNGTLQLGNVDFVVLDEVDRMLDMGFQDSVEDILKTIYLEGRAKKAQTLFFSATCPSWVLKIAKKYMDNKYKYVDLIGDSRLKTSTTVEHLAIQCSYQDRASTIGTVLQVYSGQHGRAMIFCQTKKDADELTCSSEIKQEGHVLHGDIPQDKRELVLEKFRAGKYRVLITTDVAARGLDIPEVDLVIQCSPPKDYESYVHRSGRTGRAGRTGVCVCFYKKQETEGLLQLERKTGIKFKRVGAPSTNEIVMASANDAARSLDTVSDDLIERFRSGAEEVLKNKDAVNALAAALAVISGCTKVTQRSLLSSKENFTTYHLYKLDEQVRGKSFAFAMLKKILGEDKVESAIDRISFTKDKMGLVFDVASEYDELIQAKWYNTKSLEMKPISELPELEEEVSNGRFGSGGGGGGGRFGNRGGRGNAGGGNRRFDRNGSGGGNRGFGNKSNGFSNGNKSGGFGNKRKFDDSSKSKETSNKKIRFDD